MTEKTTAYVQYLFLTQQAQCVPQNKITITGDESAEVKADNGIFRFAIGDDDVLHYLEDYDSIVEQATDYLATILGAVDKTGSTVGAWESIEQYIVKLLEDYDIPVELTGRVMRQACEKYEEQGGREIDLARNAMDAEIYD